MSSDNRARTRAIRAQMAASGENYPRAAHSVHVRPARPLRAVCFTCKTDIPDGGGIIHIAHHEVNQVERARAAAREQRAARAAAEDLPGGIDTFTVADLLAGPDDARWQVHCDSCNPHQDDGCEGCYWLAVERCRTWSQLIDWTAHLVEKSWVLAATDWTEFIRTAAHGTSNVGLICDPADRYYDA